MNIKKMILLGIDKCFRNADQITMFNIGSNISVIHKEQKVAQYKEIISTRIANSPESSKKLVQSLLENELKYCLNEWAVDTTISKNALHAKVNMLLNISANVAQQIHALTSIVGVQAMSGPVGLLYQMNVTHIELDSNRIQLEIISTAVQAKAKSLSARYSLESVYDLQRAHSINANDEVAKILTTEINYEIINGVIDNLISIARSNYKHIVRRADDTPIQHIKHVLAGIHRASNQIATATRRGKGNYIICSIDSARKIKEYLDSSYGLTLELSQTEPCSQLTHFGNIVQDDSHVVYKVYVSEHIFDCQGQNRFLIGYKGVGETDAGYFYCPYVPVMTSGVMANPQTFEPIVSLITRCGEHVDLNTGKYCDATNYYRLVDADQ